MEFRILGPLEVVDDGHALDLGGQKQRALLALLLLEANRVVSRDRLIDALWEQEPPETALKALQVYVSQLRKLLGKERLQTKAPGYLLRVEPEELDLARFQRLQGQGNLQEALSLWRGPPLAEFAYQRFAQAGDRPPRGAAPRLPRGAASTPTSRAAATPSSSASSRRSCRSTRSASASAPSSCSRSTAPAARRRRSTPTRRRARARRRARHRARPQLRELHQAILRQDPGLDLAAGPNPAAETAQSAFVGREAELAELLAGLEDALAGRGRLFLLVGEPGIGKSRLADELIRRAQGRGVRVLVGRCWEAGGAPAYWPWVQSLRGYIRDAERELLRTQLGAGAAELAADPAGAAETSPVCRSRLRVESEARDSDCSTRRPSSFGTHP